MINKIINNIIQSEELLHSSFLLLKMLLAEKGEATSLGKKYITGKNNGFPILDILGYLKNTHKNPKFGRVRQIPIWELGWEFPDWDL